MKDKKKVHMSEGCSHIIRENELGRDEYIQLEDCYLHIREREHSTAYIFRKIYSILMPDCGKEVFSREVVYSDGEIESIKYNIENKLIITKYKEDDRSCKFEDGNGHQIFPHNSDKEVIVRNIDEVEETFEDDYKMERVRSIAKFCFEEYVEPLKYLVPNIDFLKLWSDRLTEQQELE